MSTVACERSLHSHLSSLHTCIAAVFHILCRYSVENSYLEEKEDTCNALGEMAESLGSAFLPYLDDCFTEVNVLSEVSHDS